MAEFGGPASHAALLTREMGIPAVTHVSAASDAIAPGAIVLVDGFTGTVVVAPDAETQAGFEKRVAEQRVSRAAARGRCASRRRPWTAWPRWSWPTSDAAKTPRWPSTTARTAWGSTAWNSSICHAKRCPPKTSCSRSCVSAVEPLAGKPITVRLLDVGADKKLPSIDLRSEVNPFLGRRGVRVLLAYPELLQTQLRALARLSRELDIHILVPMVTLAEEMKSLRELLMVAAAHVGVKRLPPLGAMIETPAAALCVVDIVQHADFLSLGTNDLTQYTMAAGREDPLVSDYFRDDHPAVRRLLGLVAEAAGETPLALCGELAGRLDMLPFLLATGIHSFSVAPPLVPSVKEAVRTYRIK